MAIVEEKKGWFFMEKKKVLVAGLLTATLTVSGQFVQFDNSQLAPMVGMQSAQAFGLGGLKDVAKKGAKDSVKKSLGFNIDAMENKRENLVANLINATVLKGYSAVTLRELNGDANTQDALAIKNALANYKSKATNFKDFAGLKNFTEGIGKLEQKPLSNLKSAKEITNEAELAKMNETVSLSNSARVQSNIYLGLAARDAAMILSSSAKALAQPGELGDKVNEVKDLADFAKQAQEILNLQKKQSKERKVQMDELKKKGFGAKDPDAKTSAKLLQDKGITKMLAAAKG